MIFEAKPLGSYCTRFVTAGGFSPRAAGFARHTGTLLSVRFTASA